MTPIPQPTAAASHTAAPLSPGRSLWRTAFEPGQYSHHEYRITVASCQEANVVSSACGVEVGETQAFLLDLVHPDVSGCAHAPAVDLDVPAALTAPPGAQQAEVLWIQPERKGLGRIRIVARLRWWRAQRVLARSGLTHAPRWHELSQRARQRAFQAAEGYDDSVRHEVLRRLGEEFPGSLDELNALSTQLGLEARSGGKRDLHDPWPLRLQVPTDLIASTRNAHCYMEARLSWDTYQQVLVALVRAGVVERGYLRASQRRGQSFLRLPWVEKTPEELAKPKLTETQRRIQRLQRLLGKLQDRRRSWWFDLRWRLWGARRNAALIKAMQARAASGAEEPF